MQRFILASLTTLTLATTFAPAVKAEPSAVNPYVAPTEATENQINPAQLVFLAKQGAFKAQGIPSNNALASEYKLGRLTAKDLVEVAVKEGRLSTQVANDQGYLNAVDAQLAIVNNVY